MNTFVLIMLNLSPATGGIDTTVCLWNPYVISKPVGILTGHMAAVVQIIVNTSKSQLISFSQDKVTLFIGNMYFLVFG